MGNKNLRLLELGKYISSMHEVEKSASTRISEIKVLEKCIPSKTEQTHKIKVMHIEAYTWKSTTTVHPL